MSRLLAALILAGLLITPAAVRAEDAPPPPPEPKVTLKLEKVPLRKALELLFKGTNKQYAITSDVPDVAITLNIRDMEFGAALRLMIRLAAAQVPGLTVSKEPSSR
jgi:hypothetical protein